MVIFGNVHTTLECPKVFKALQMIENDSSGLGDVFKMMLKESGLTWKMKKAPEDTCDLEGPWEAMIKTYVIFNAIQVCDQESADNIKLLFEWCIDVLENVIHIPVKDTEVQTNTYIEEKFKRKSKICTRVKLEKSDGGESLTSIGKDLPMITDNDTFTLGSTSHVIGHLREGQNEEVEDEQQGEEIPKEDEMEKIRQDHGDEEVDDEHKHNVEDEKKHQLEGDEEESVNNSKKASDPKHRKSKEKVSKLIDEFLTNIMDTDDKETGVDSRHEKENEQQEMDHKKHGNKKENIKQDEGQGMQTRLRKSNELKMPVETEPEVKIEELSDDEEETEKEEDEDSNNSLNYGSGSDVENGGDSSKSFTDNDGTEHEDDEENGPIFDEYHILSEKLFKPDAEAKQRKRVRKRQSTTHRSGLQQRDNWYYRNKLSQR